MKGSRPADTLTARQKEVAALLRLPNEEIAVKLRIRVQTVKNHVTAIMDKTGMGSRQEVCCYFCQNSPEPQKSP